MRSIINFAAVILLLQGLIGFVGRVAFDSEWGFLHRLVDLPTPAYLGVAAAGAVALIWADIASKRDQS
ncbi:hypothetical protein [Nonomuraea insulae]|uniref:Uncharacterized protein n=1 Tax=Nonomuraea insulae TaxID=1616787 RepID=A0ABW1CJM3_9ACTN